MNKNTSLNWISIREPMTYTEVKGVSNELCVNLPEDYCSIIGPINGGVLRNAFILDQNRKNISYSRNVSLSKKSKVNIFMLYTEDSEFKPRYFPFGSVGNGDYFCFDLDNQTVVLWQHEIDRYIYICQTFTELLDMIQEVDE